MTSSRQVPRRHQGDGRGKHTSWHRSSPQTPMTRAWDSARWAVSSGPTASAATTSPQSV